MRRTVCEEKITAARMETPEVVAITRVGSSARTEAERANAGLAWSERGRHRHSVLRALKGKPGRPYTRVPASGLERIRRGPFTYHKGLTETIRDFRKADAGAGQTEDPIPKNGHRRHPSRMCKPLVSHFV